MEQSLKLLKIGIVKSLVAIVIVSMLLKISIIDGLFMAIIIFSLLALNDIKKGMEYEKR